MKKQYLQIAVCALLALGGATTASATSVAWDNSSTINVFQVDTFVATGSNMATAGLDVTVTFVGGSFQTTSWTATGPDSGAATGTGWGISLAGDTYFNPWVLNVDGSVAIKEILFEGSGNVVFDRIPTPFITTNSDLGLPFNDIFSTYSTISGRSIDVLYSQLVAETSTGLPAQGDIYSNMLITFDDYGFGGVFGSAALVSDTLTFEADTDLVASEPVPEPATMLLVGTGLSGLAAFRRRKGK